MDLEKIPTPAYVVDEKLLKKNLEVLLHVKKETGCKILLAQKAFSMFAMYPLIGEYLDGTTASSLFEAKLGYEKMGKETHIYNPAYTEEDFEEIVTVCDHIVFNTPEQFEKWKKKVNRAEKKISCGLRINPEYSEVETDLYNPCFKYSRLGTTLENLTGKITCDDLKGLEGFHFHTMCEQNADVLKRTILAVEEKFGDYLGSLKWINFGGGHHITRKDYDIETLIWCIRYVQEKYNVQVYLEPGEAVALNTGFLVTKVLDIMENGMKLAILDTSAECHMPDVLEMPYRPEIIGAKEAGVLPYTYRFGGPTCLAGDIIGDYSFQNELHVGDKLVFCDMAHYTMVKNNMFNGINLPSIAVYHESGKLEIVQKFGYTDFMTRLS